MSRLGLKIGLATALLLLITVATMGAVSADTVPVMFNNSTANMVELTFKGVDNNTASDPAFVNVTYRDTFTISVTFVNSSIEDQEVDILIYRGGDLIASYYGKKVGDEITIDTEQAGMTPAWYVIKVRYTVENGPTEILDSRCNTTLGKPCKPLYLSVDPSEYERPIIELDLKNPSNYIAFGDKIRIGVKVWGKDRCKWYFERWWKDPFKDSESYNATGTGEGVWGWLNGSDNYVAKTVEIDTFFLVNNTTINADEGSYTIKFEAGETTKELTVHLVKPAVTELNVDKKEIVPDAEQKITGKTNIAKTDGDEDAKGTNYVYLILINTTNFAEGDLKLNLSGEFTLPINTSARAVIANLTDSDKTDSYKTVKIGDYHYKVFFAKATVLSDGTFEKTFKLAGVDTDEDWTVFAVALTVNASVLSSVDPNSSINDNGYADMIIGKNVAYFRVVEPKIEFTMDKTVIARGEDFKVKGKTNLPEGSKIHIVFENGDNFECEAGFENTTAVTNGKYVDVEVGSDGTFESPKITVKSTASLTTYKIYAVWDSNWNADKNDKSKWDVYETLTIRVVKHKLEAYIDPDVVTPEGKVTIYGNTTADKVYIFTDEAGVLDGVKKKTDQNLANPSSTASITVSDGKFKKEFKVITDEEGTYTIYVFAPADTSKIDESTDAQVVLSLTVVPVKYNETTLPSEITMVRGQKVTVTFYVEGSSDTMKKVKISASLKGQGISIDIPSNKITVDNDGKVEFDVLPYYNESQGVLTDNATYNKTLAVGVYTLKLKLYYNNSLVEDGIKEIVFKVVEPTLDVEVPSEVVKGETLKVTVYTNRAEGYDHIWVVLKAPMKTYVQRVTTDENGTAIAEFETMGLTTGDYKIYVRDTLGTVAKMKERDFVESYYDLQPTEGVAKDYKADDDVLWIGEVKIVEAAAVTPTPTTPTPTTPTPTTPTPTTPTPTTPPETTTVVTTPPPTTTTPTPGFEAIFAVAGLLAIAYLLRRRQ